MNTFLRNTISKLCNAVSATVTATWDALAERLRSVRDTASLLYNRMMENMGHGRGRSKDIVKKETEEEKPKRSKISEAYKTCWFWRHSKTPKREYHVVWTKDGQREECRIYIAVSLQQGPAQKYLSQNKHGIIGRPLFLHQEDGCAL